MNTGRFPSTYYYLNDTLSIAEMIEPTGNSGYNESLARWNMTTGKIETLPYEHPKIQRKRTAFAVSFERGLYAEGYVYHDLMTIGTLDGDLKYNVYGSAWDSSVSNKIMYYYALGFCGDRIFALYSGESTVVDERTNLPTKFLVFDLDGNYLQTLETGCDISGFCYDADNNRIIMTLTSEMQFAYLDLDGLI